MSSRTQNEKDSERNTSFETAARTRPLSIQEILLRREKKAASEAKKTKEGLQNNDKGKANHLEPGKGHTSRKGLRDIPVEGSKKENIRDTPREDTKKNYLRRTSKEGPKKDNTRSTPREVSKKEKLKDRPKDRSKMDDLKDTPKVPRKDDQRDAPNKSSKKEKPSVRDDTHSAAKDKGTHNPSKSMSGWADESKDGNHGEIRARNGDATRSESLKGSGKRWNGETVDDDRIKERSEKLWNGTKRKDCAFDSEKSSEVDRQVLKRHDSGRFQDSRNPDRNEGRYVKPYHEEPRSKRRRSRSRDYDRKRRGRSVLLSPREQRHSYRGGDHDDYCPYYSVDKSSRKYAEIDRHRTSGDVGHTGGSYWRYESQLGGYSPRKRRTAPNNEQATTKTAPPAVRSPEKKSATWDQPPVGADQSNFFTTLQTTVSQMASSASISFTASNQKPATTLETILSWNSSSIDSVQLTQATRPLRRLHIENIPSSATEDLLIGCLNDFLLASGVNHIQSSKQPCLSCTINKEKHQAFVEFLTPEDATAALFFDGKSFNGSTLKIRRPKEYVEMANVASKKPAEETKSISDVVAYSLHKIFIAGISGVISSEMLVEIVSAFGQLAAYRFLCNEDLGGQCAFLQYIDHSTTSKACAGLNGMKLGGRILTAVQVGNEASPFYGVPDSAKSLLEEPTKVLQLKNVFDREEYLLLSKSELEELLKDIRMECSRFGAVKSINIVGYPASSDDTTEDVIAQPTDIVQPTDGSVKIGLTECSASANCKETGTECSLPNKSIDVPGHSDPTETKYVDPISEGHEEQLDTLCERNAPAETGKSTDLDDIHAIADVPTLGQHMEADHVDSVEADHDATAVDDGTSEKGHEDPRTLETYSSTAPRDAVEISEGEDKQQDANDGSESGEKVPAVDFREEALVSDTTVLDAGSVLVEFMWKEATCMAAHSLHGRCFGDRIVSAGYAPHDLYLRRYPEVISAATRLCCSDDSRSLPM